MISGEAGPATWPRNGRGIQLMLDEAPGKSLEAEEARISLPARMPEVRARVFNPGHTVGASGAR